MKRLLCSDQVLTAPYSHNDKARLDCNIVGPARRSLSFVRVHIHGPMVQQTGGHPSQPSFPPHLIVSGGASRAPAGPLPHAAAASVKHMICWILGNAGTTICFPCCCFARVTLLLGNVPSMVQYACDSANTRCMSARRAFCCWQTSSAKILRHGWSQRSQSKPVLEFCAAQSRVRHLLGVDLPRPRGAVIGLGAGVAAKPSHA